MFLCCVDFQICYFCTSIIDDLWHLLDSTIDQSRRRSGTTVEVDRYLSEVNLTRSEDPQVSISIYIYTSWHWHCYVPLHPLSLAC